jgi:hypothetical protein
MKSEIVYRIYHPSKALIWNTMFASDDASLNAINGFWSEWDHYVIEFGNTDEEYEQAKALADLVNGVVEECRK